MRFAGLYLVLLLAVYSIGQNVVPEKRQHRARPAIPEGPQIDGSLNDPAWVNISFDDRFVQINPIEGAAPSERTAFKVVYDDKYIYVGVYSFDSQPDSITSRVSRRDDVSDCDLILVGFDSFLDRRTAFVFGLNAGGVKADYLISQDGGEEDTNWDPVWKGVTSITDSGWVAEFRIPFSQLRFADKSDHTWGFEVYRMIHRKQEEHNWQHIPKDAAGLVSYFGDLVGLKDIKARPRIEILPYALTSFQSYEAEKGNPFKSGNDFKFDAGLDGKIGITGDLTVDLTINPDFGQVEADPSEVNLSAFETFFEERRPFFIEGGNIFKFPLAIGGGHESEENLFYSRRIGRRPHYYPEEEDGFTYDYEKVPEQTQILGAAKLSGKTENGWSIGLLNAVTNKEYAELDYKGEKSKVNVEPLTNYFVGRLAKDFNEGNTALGAMLTATNRKIEDDHLKFLNKSAYTGGIDFRHQWDSKTYFFNFKLAGSYLNGDRRAIQHVQEASARYFQRPDADYITYDTTRTSLRGHGGTINIGKEGNGRWRFALGTLWRSPGLELNDVGYLRRADQISPFVWIGYRILNPVSIFRRISLNYNQEIGWNFGGEQIFQGGNVNGGVQFLNYWDIQAYISRRGSGLSSYMLRGGPAARTEGSWTTRLSFHSDDRNDWELHGRISNNVSDDNISSRFKADLEFSYRAHHKLEFSINPFYNLKQENLQYITTEDFNAAKRYIFGYIDQKTFGTVFRVNYSPTPDISIQYFGQPFISAGAYNTFKYITNPRARGADRYLDYTPDQISFNVGSSEYLIDETRNGITDYRIENPEFNYKEFLSNLVVRWEYMPGSTVYFVWSQQRDDDIDDGSFSLNRDLDRLFARPANNMFLIKLNYWFTIK